MKKNMNSLKSSLRQEQGKTTKSQNQKQTIFHYLQEHTATASMVTDATGIAQKCITRYKRDLEKANRLWEVIRTFCQLTGFRAYYLTTDPTKAPKTAKLNLFEKGGANE
jgi:hypothetical protein